MGLKKFNVKKEIKKIGKKRNRIKRVGVIGISIASIFVISSYALYSFTTNNVAFSATSNKRVKTTVTTTNGTVVVFADKILADNKVKKETPDFSVGEPPESGSQTVGSGVFISQDDDGDSYYFRGDKNLLNNNVKFGKDKNGNDLRWKIVRINGDGTIRLILVDDNFNGIKSIGNSQFNDYTNDGSAHHNMVGFTYDNASGEECTKDHPCEVTYDVSSKTFNNSFGGTNSDIKNALETWYKDNLNDVDNKIAQGYFCNDTSSPRYTYNASSTSTVFYEAWLRIGKNPSLECPDPVDKDNKVRPYGGIYKTKIGLLTADEMNMAGINYQDLSYQDSSPNATSNNYLYCDYWRSLSPSYSSNIAFVFGGEYGYLSFRNTSNSEAVVPVINLRSDVQVTGEGTVSNPYEVVGIGTKEGDYKETQTFKVYPNEGYEYESASCDNVQASYDAKTNTLTVSNPTKDTTCTVKFKNPCAGYKEILGKRYCVIADNPDFSKGYPNDTDKDSSKSGLYKTKDNEGDTYYFRGDKTKLNNNVKFGGKNWKIVRINGDGTIRLILVDDFTNSGQPLSIVTSAFNTYTYNSSTPQHNMVGFTYNNNKTHECTKNNPCEVTYDASNNSFNNNNFGGTNSDIKTALETWYRDNLKGYDNKIASGYFCNDTSSPRYTYNANDTSTMVYYGAYDRIKKTTPPAPSLECPDPVDNKGTKRPYGGIYKTKIGLLTADEMNMAGLNYVYSSSTNATSNYLYYGSGYWWSLSPHSSDYRASVFEGYRGYIGYSSTYATYAVVPVINLSADTLTTNGDGSTSSPFQVD